jgi:hypothetical protein
MTERIGAFARTYWPVLVAIVLASAAWGTSTAQISYLGKGQDRIEAKIDAISDGLSTAKAGLQYATKYIDDLRVRVNALETRN